MADSALKSVTELLSNQKKKEGSSIQPKEFFWDQFLKYIASAILALTVLNISVEFLRGGGVSCFPPSDNVAISDRDLEGKMLYEFARGQTSYVNNYCARSIPKTEYFPMYIIIHGILLIVPHYVWSALHNGDFDSFFSIVEKLDRLRNSQTGEYDTNNFDRVAKLEQEYSGRRIYFTYILKLILQLLICIGSVVLSSTYFTNFSFIFFCPGSSIDEYPCPEDHVDIGTPCGWPLNLTVPCVYTSLRILSLVRYADFVLLVVAAGLVLFGLVWCLVRHTEQLGYSELAKFAFQSCLNSNDYVFPPIVSWPTYSRFTQEKADSEAAEMIERLWPITHYPCLHIRHIFSPRILHDVDFLLLMLFRADNSHGQVFKDIQTTKELKRVVGRDHQLLHLYITLQQLPPLKPSNEDNDSSPAPQKKQGFWRTFFRLFCRRRNEQTRAPTGATNCGYRVDSNTEGDDRGYEDGNDHLQNSSADVQGTQQGRSAEDTLHRAYLSEQNPERVTYEKYKDHLGELEYHEEYMQGIRDKLFWFAKKFGPKLTEDQPTCRNELALDIAFGSIGYSLILSRPFIKVISVNFQPHYKNTSKDAALSEEYYTNYSAIKFPGDLYTQSTESITAAQERVLECVKGYKDPPDPLDLIVVSPITEESKLVSVNLLLNVLFKQNLIGEDALLLAIRPLKIGSKKVKDRFYKYVPSKKLFKQDEKVVPELKSSEKHMVDESLGIRINCGTTQCVFEMIAYKFIQDRDDDDQDVFGNEMTQVATSNQSGAQGGRNKSSTTGQETTL